MNWKWWTRKISEPKLEGDEPKNISELKNGMNQKRRWTYEGDEPKDIKWIEKSDELNISEPKKAMNQ